jgi:hypothetical protein
METATATEATVPRVEAGAVGVITEPLHENTPRQKYARLHQKLLKPLYF